MCTACGGTGYIKVGSGTSNTTAVESRDLYWMLTPCWCVSWLRLPSYSWDYDKPWPPQREQPTCANPSL